MPQTGIGKIVLVVDDKEENRRLIRKILVMHGYKVIEAESGESAVDLTQSDHPDLVLMDIRLREGISGIEATRQIKAIDQTSRIPIIAVTASVSPEDMQIALDSGCSGFIRKPIDIDLFPGQVAGYIKTP
jgi:CheY-like chemotaxis protein